MLKIIVPGTEMFDEEKQEFFTVGDVPLELEHSLVSLSKWESIFEKPFLAEGNRTPEEVFAYVKCMVLTPGVPDEVLYKLNEENYSAINRYIESKQSATWFSEEAPKQRNQETLTSELIYYWLVAFQIPFETETWHINRLFNLIRICDLKQQKPKKMSAAEAAAKRRELNEKRKAQFGTTG